MVATIALAVALSRTPTPVPEVAGTQLAGPVHPYVLHDRAGHQL